MLVRHGPALIAVARLIRLEEFLPSPPRLSLRQPLVLACSLLGMRRGNSDGTRDSSVLRLELTTVFDCVRRLSLFNAACLTQRSASRLHENNSQLLNIQYIASVWR